MFQVWILVESTWTEYNDRLWEGPRKAVMYRVARELTHCKVGTVRVRQVH